MHNHCMCVSLSAARSACSDWLSPCRYMCTTSVPPYLLSSVCFKCIVKRHIYLWGANKQPNANAGFFFFFFFFFWFVDCSDFEHNARNIEMHTTWGWLETTVYSSVSVSPWQSPASPWTWNEEQAAGPVTLSLAGAATSIIFVVTNTSFVPTKVCLSLQNLCRNKITFLATK